MKPQQKREFRAFTRIELMVVCALVTILAGMLLPALAQSQQRAQRLMCVNNLKLIGIAYRVWGDSHGGRTPASETVAEGGWQDLDGGGLVGPGVGNYCGPACFTNYEIMQTELGQSPKTVLCPADDRTANTNFYDPHWREATGTFNNTNCSYWVGAGASGAYPRSLLAGDRNLGGGATATEGGTQDPD